MSLAASGKQTSNVRSARDAASPPVGHQAIQDGVDGGVSTHMNDSATAGGGKSGHSGQRGNRMLFRTRQAHEKEPIAAEDDEEMWGPAGAGELHASSHKGRGEVGSTASPERQQWDTSIELNVDELVRKEVQWLKGEGYLAGSASFHEVRTGASECRCS
jgi:hypothetical protein